MDKVQEYHVEFADKLATHDLTIDEFIPVFKHLADFGEMKILLFQGCPCNIKVRLDWGNQGASLERTENMCDNCMRHNEDNKERIGAILHGLSELNVKFLGTERGQKMTTEAVKRNVGKDIDGVHAVGGKNEPSKHTQGQMILHALMTAHKWLEKYQSQFSEHEKKSWDSLNAFIVGLLSEPYWRNDTDELQRVIGLAKESAESVLKDTAQEIADENGVDIKSVLDDIKQKLQDKDKEEHE
jgi:hypothetical protein|tara:strand:+ start:888 stop:1610 length:723 start_codon:yes stop_codon:yes gene_type:complete